MIPVDHSSLICDMAYNQIVAKVSLHKYSPSAIDAAARLSLYSVVALAMAFYIATG